MGTPLIYGTTVELARPHCARARGMRHLDIGAGAGQLVEMFRKEFGVETRVCDYTDKLMKAPAQKVEIANLNEEGLPYPDGHFDVVTATEVVEHLEHYRETLREIHRVLRPGGLAILSTPNILNLKSRLRFLTFGFWNLFGPLPVRNSALNSTGGHINPVSSFYLMHSMMDAGFNSVGWRTDKIQRSGVLPFVLLYPVLRICAWLAWRREVNRYETIDDANAPLVRAMNHPRMLLGRTLFVFGYKPNENALSEI
ncbi:MAG: class I SAM-dependent methyltransferase [Verrucomicrobia bacterium]|nr:class I SAM-dependent methyltransferase [Verrucomicrobiota bacterium]MBI3867848.1 class I SAM-dependent methyltransferase [Verrucomicrobiota bacterium]